MNSFIKTDKYITIVFDDGKTVTTYNNNVSYTPICDAIKNDDWETVRTIAFPADVVKVIISPIGPRVSIANGIVTLDGVPVDGTLIDRMVDMFEDGFDISAMTMFLENLYENTSYRAVNELYDFLESSNLPLTDDGHFIAYKRVRNDWKDIYSGTVDNSPGTVVSIARNQVNEDKTNTCSYGLHFCAREYLDFYIGNHNSKVIMVKINPRDVVAIPADYNNAKGRTCRYEVIMEMELEEKTRQRLPLEKLEKSVVKEIKVPPSTETSDVVIDQVDPLTATVIAMYPTVAAASKETGIDRSSIRKVCKGTRNSAGGFIWIERVINNHPNDDENDWDAEYGTPDDDDDEFYA
jgi:hypothetical protein